MTSVSGPGPVLVIGCVGALGQEILKQLQEAKIPALGLGRAEIDIGADLKTLLATLEKMAPSAVLNCLAMTGLDRCFREQSQAFEANGIFPTKLAAASKVLGLPVVQFSTENVFSCNINGLTYRETDETRPTTVYGLSKLCGEVREIWGQAPFHVLRLPLLFGPTNRKQIVARLVKALLCGNEVTVASDVFSTPAFTPDIAGFAVAWLKSGKALAPVTHLTSGHRLSLHELICIIAKGIEAKGKIQSTLSSRFPSLENKPLHGGLISDVTEPLPWDGAIARYVEWIKLNRKVITDET